MVVALAIAHPTNAAAAAAQLTPDEFYRPALAAALEAAAQLDRVADLTRRISAVAIATGLRESAIAAYVDNRVGPMERWTRKVRTTARRRRAMALAAHIYNEAAAADATELVATARDLLAEFETLAAETPPSPPNTPVSKRHALGYYRRQPENTASS